MIRVADGAADVTFVSDRGMYFRGVIFDVPPGKNMFFSAPTATFVSNEVMLAPIFDEVLQGPVSVCSRGQLWARVTYI